MSSISRCLKSIERFNEGLSIPFANPNYYFSMENPEVRIITSALKELSEIEKAGDLPIEYQLIYMRGISTITRNYILCESDSKKNKKELSQYLRFFSFTLLEFNKYSSNFEISEAEIQALVLISPWLKKEEKNLLVSKSTMKSFNLKNFLLKKPQIFNLPIRWEHLSVELKKHNLASISRIPNTIANTNLKAYFRFLKYHADLTHAELKNLEFYGYIQNYNKEDKKLFFIERNPEFIDAEHCIREFVFKDSPNSIYSYLKRKEACLDQYFKDNIDSLKSALVKEYPRFESFSFLFTSPKTDWSYLIDETIHLPSRVLEFLKIPKEKEFLKSLFGFQSSNLSQFIKQDPETELPAKKFLKFLALGEICKMAKIDHNDAWKLLNHPTTLTLLKDLKYDYSLCENQEEFVSFLEFFDRHQKLLFLKNSFDLAKKTKSYYCDPIDFCNNLAADSFEVYREQVKSITFNEINNIEKLYTVLNQIKQRIENPLVSYESVYEDNFGTKSLTMPSINVGGESLKVIVPKTNHELYDWGAVMRNCIGTYAKDHGLESIVFAILRKNKIFCCVEIEFEDEFYFNKDADFKALKEVRDYIIDSANPFKISLKEAKGFANKDLDEATYGDVLKYTQKEVHSIFDARKAELLQELEVVLTEKEPAVDKFFKKLKKYFNIG